MLRVLNVATRAVSNLLSVSEARNISPRFFAKEQSLTLLPLKLRLLSRPSLGYHPMWEFLRAGRNLFLEKMFELV
jgi:hypothetical protein